MHKADADWAECGLSRREPQVLSGAAAGLTNQELADEPFLGIDSVKTYIRGT